MRSVIVVDDDPDAARSLSHLLEICGVEVLGIALDGKEAVSLYKEKHPDIVILDMFMPHYDGKYAIKGIKDDDPKARIVVVTAYRQNYTFEENEVDNIYDKPYKLSDIMKEIS